MDAKRRNDIIKVILLASVLLMGLWALQLILPTYRASVKDEVSDVRGLILLKHLLLTMTLIGVFVLYSTSLRSRIDLVLKVMFYSFVVKIWLLYFADNTLSAEIISPCLILAKSMLGCKLEESLVPTLLEPFFVCGLLFSLKLLELQKDRPSWFVLWVTVTAPRILGLLLGV